MLPLSVACARICIKTFTATTLIVQLPKTLSTALLILKFLDYCVYNNINIKIENPLHTINLKPIYNSLYKNLEIEYISVKRLCFLILLISESKSINCYKQSLDFTKKTRAKRFYFGLKRNQVIKVNQGHCLIDLFMVGDHVMSGDEEITVSPSSMVLTLTLFLARGLMGVEVQRESSSYTATLFLTVG